MSKARATSPDVIHSFGGLPKSGRPRAFEANFAYDLRITAQSPRSNRFRSSIDEGQSFGGSGSRRSLFTVFTLFLKTAIICAPSHSGQRAPEESAGSS